MSILQSQKPTIQCVSFQIQLVICGVILHITRLTNMFHTLVKFIITFSNPILYVVDECE